MRYLIFIFLLQGSIAYSCDTSALDSLPPGSVLSASLDTFHTQQLNAQLAEFEISNRGNWMNYIPSIGIGYNPQGKPRPTASFSLSQILTSQKNRQALEAKRRAILQAAELQRLSDQRHLQSMIQKYELLSQALETTFQVHELDTQLMEFYETQFQNHEIGAKDIILKRRDFLLKKQGVREKEMELKILEREVLEFCHHSAYQKKVGRF